MIATTMVAVKTVLIADDTAFVRDRFKMALEGAGHRAVTVRTGQELLAALRGQQRIDLVVLDLRLPDGRGIDLVRSLRRVAPEKPPIVVFSGTIANAAEVRDLSSFGVAGYVNEYTGVGHIMPALAPHLFPEHYNRRSSPRVVLGVPITYRVGNAISTSLTLNVSHGGVAIRTTNPLDVASVVRLRFRLPGTKKEVDAEARVAWSDRRVGMGLQFTSIDPPAQALIDNYVQTHFFSNRKA
ncbi:MAG TPA: PilZ domain-containing protein [Vicinamibacterales bacterium]|nr:PilZ domain-containing protein [Vicinamibacterales bacterium]